MISADIQTVLPEIVIALYAMGALLAAVYTSKDEVAPLLTWLTGGLFVVMAGWIGYNGEGVNVAFDGAYVDDGFGRFAKVVILLSAAVVLVMSQEYMSRRGLLRFEYPLLVALAVVGGRQRFAVQRRAGLHDAARGRAPRGAGSASGRPAAPARCRAL